MPNLSWGVHYLLVFWYEHLSVYSNNILFLFLIIIVVSCVMNYKWYVWVKLNVSTNAYDSLKLFSKQQPYNKPQKI